jgi:hypothetical protein
MKNKKKESKLNIKKIIINYLLFISIFIIGIVVIINNTIYENKKEDKYISKNKQKMNNAQKRSAMSNSIREAFEK